MLDATANPPTQLSGSAGFYSGVGTILFSAAGDVRDLPPARPQRQSRGGSHEGEGGWMYKKDKIALPSISDTNLRASVTVGNALTFTCMPPATGVRLGIDRDVDTFLDGDERTAGTDMTDPNNHP